MKKQILLFFFTLSISSVSGQLRNEFVILKATNELAKQDTVFGEILFPSNGILAAVNIQTTEGKKKYSLNKVVGFIYKDRYFVSVPYLRGHVFAERLLNGKIELCLYSTEIQNASYHGGLSEYIMANVGVGLTSYYYIKSNKTQDYISVPHSKTKLRKKIAFIFEDNESIYKQILSNDFDTNQLPELVQNYNSSNDSNINE